MIASAMTAAVSWLARPAMAGPPLIADDPNTVGPSVVQPIFAVSFFGRDELTLVQGPIIDLTVGLVDSLDATLVASFAISQDNASDPPLIEGGVLTPGLKWQFLRTDRGSLAFSPALTVDVGLPDVLFGLLPVQGELSIGKRGSVVGFDVGYLPVRRRTDGWFVAFYGAYATTPDLKVLFEIWGISPGPLVGVAVDIGGSVGIDYGISGQAVRLLASLSTGFASIGLPRVDLRAYLGIQYTIGTPSRWRSRL